MEDNAVNFSITYGVLFLLPIMAAVLYVISNNRISHILLWLPLLLLVGLFGLLLDDAFVYSSELLWPIVLLVLAACLQLFRLVYSFKSV